MARRNRDATSAEEKYYGTWKARFSFKVVSECIFNLIFEKFYVLRILTFQIVECVSLAGSVDTSGIEGCVLSYGCHIVTVVYYINNKTIQV